MTSIGSMIKRCAGLHGTPDLSAWETKFVASISDMTDSGDKTASLSEKQIECIERIHNKHFGGK